MILNNLVMMGHAEPVCIQIAQGRVERLTEGIKADEADPLQLHFNHALVFPGLINSHDHLDFNLFPAFGDRIYENYTEWGKYIHDNYSDEIAAVLTIPIVLREQWGMLKNLICGVTTVVNHGESLTIKDRPISVHEQYYCLHSVQFEKKWKLKLNHPLNIKYPVVIHIGEGTNEAAKEEINQLIQWNLLHKTLIGVHAVAMSAKQAEKFKAIVWCPQSNYFLLNKTAPVDELKKYTKILFGTDSTLTGNWDIWDHIRLARETKLLTDLELYETLHLNPSAIWGLPNREIAAGNNADIVIARIKDDKDVMNAFFSVEPKDILLVMHQGNIRMFDSSLHPQLISEDLSGFSKININGANKYIQGDVPGLMKNIKRYYPRADFPIYTH